MIQLKKVNLPDFGCGERPPELTIDEYQSRIAAAVERMKQEKLDILLVYADREHFANLAYLTGFDPRFEEALLLLDAAGRRQLIVGNECMGYLPDSKLGCEVVLFQDFSLLGQPRGASAPLRTILSEFGIGAGRAVGCVGWKYFDGKLVDGGAAALDIPSFIADTVRALAGNGARVVNATAMFMNPDDGLRSTNSAAQIAQFEYASCKTSNATLKLLEQLKPGVTESELERLYDGGGLPLSCHRMVSFGSKAKRGLASPSENRAKIGDAFTAALGVWGSLTCRAGVVAAHAEQLPADIRDFYPQYVSNYFDVVATWYESIGVDAIAGDVYAAVEARRDRKLFDFAVNPGHLIHLDEWVHSPFTPGSRSKLRSGMALQMDIIPVSKGPFCCSNAEDGIVLADERLRGELSTKHPGVWKRIAARRNFMREELGIKLHESVLPLSNIPAWLPPYALERVSVLTKRES